MLTAAGSVNTARPTLKFNYDDAEARTLAKGLVFDESVLPLADRTFHDANLTQTQVDAVMAVHIEVVAHQFNPRNYTWFQRLMMAGYWLGAICRKVPRA